MYLLPRDDVIGNFPVWSEKDFLMSDAVLMLAKTLWVRRLVGS